MFQSRYKNTIYALYKNSPQHSWFLELITLLEGLFDGVKLDNVVEKQYACQEILNCYDSHVLYQQSCALHTDLMALSLTNDELEFPCGPGRLNLYSNSDFVITLLVSDHMPAQNNRCCSSTYNITLVCLQGEIPVKHWQFQEALTNTHWDRQFISTALQEKGHCLIKPGECLISDCQTGFHKVDMQKSFVALSITTKPLLDMQIEFTSDTLRPLHMIDASSDKSRSKIIFKLLPSLARSHCNVEDILQLGLTSSDHTVRWEAIKASVLAESSIAESAVLQGLKDVNDDVRQSCQRMVSECAE
ncbi:hypothetical protein AB835_10020 [Candidatus Endobugula sertula]|uniref:Uncharacterized protein n=1 Tax=Candidatus Endobugula sertula TaxID=62101 RepID=A0A1D2QNS4_9GAMM|nr:hypothetical protein AB835_10020 [Candidatus Endobugula sertula]